MNNIKVIIFPNYTYSTNRLFNLLEDDCPLIKITIVISLNPITKNLLYCTYICYSFPTQKFCNSVIAFTISKHCICIVFVKLP